MPHWIALSGICLHHHLTFRNLTVERCRMYWHGDSYWFMLMLMTNIPNLSFSFSLFQAVTRPVVIFLGCRVLVWLTSCCDSLILVRRGILSWALRGEGGYHYVNNVNKAIYISNIRNWANLWQYMDIYTDAQLFYGGLYRCHPDLSRHIIL